jgi:hypothetical protein
MLYGSWLEKRVREYMAKDPAQASRMYSPHSWNRYIRFFAGNFRRNKTKMFRLPQTSRIVYHCVHGCCPGKLFDHTITYHIGFRILRSTLTFIKHTLYSTRRILYRLKCMVLNHLDSVVFNQVFLLSPLQCTATHCRNCKRLREFEEIEISRLSYRGNSVNSKEENS